MNIVVNGPDRYELALNFFNHSYIKFTLGSGDEIKLIISKLEFIDYLIIKIVSNEYTIIYNPTTKSGDII